MSWASSSASWSSYTEEQIREIVRQASGGARIVDLAARYQVPEFVIRGWQSRYGTSVEASESEMARAGDSGPERPAHSSAALAMTQARVAQLEEENARLRRILADMAIENRTLKERLAAIG
jgi:hypothetical protein